MIDPRSLPVRFSRLKQMAASPAHYLHSCQAGDDEGGESLPLRLGTATHSLLFEGGSNLAVYDGRRAGKQWEAFDDEARAAGLHVVNRKEYDQASAIAAAVRGHALASSLLLAPSTVREQRIDWTRAGRACRSTPDAVNHGDKLLIDLKTTRCAEPEWFAREAVRRAYHAQLAFYDEAVGADDQWQHLIVAVESKAPHPVVVWRLSPAALDAGRALVTTWWEQLRQCEEANHWPGYTDQMQTLDCDGDMPALIFGDAADEEVAT